MLHCKQVFVGIKEIIYLDRVKFLLLAEFIKLSFNFSSILIVIVEFLIYLLIKNINVRQCITY